MKLGPVKTIASHTRPIQEGEPQVACTLLEDSADLVTCERCDGKGHYFDSFKTRRVRMAAGDFDMPVRSKVKCERCGATGKHGRRWWKDLHRMVIVQGWWRQHLWPRDVDVSSEVAGVIDCFECHGTGWWAFMEPEIPGEPCTDCKGTGRIYVSI